MGNKGHLDEHTLDNDYDVEDGEVLREYSDSNGEVSDGVEEHSLAFRLSHWVASDKIPNSSVDRLLGVLHDFHPDLPLTYRTLMNTGAHQIAVSQIEGGEYAHFGILNGIRSIESIHTNITAKSMMYPHNLSLRRDDVPDDHYCVYAARLVCTNADGNGGQLWAPYCDSRFHQSSLST